MSELTHFNSDGNAHMVDVGDKAVTRRVAIAEGRIRMQPETLQRIVAGDNKKGDVLGVARIAGIMASKKTADLIPLCHPLALSRVDIDLVPKVEDSTVSCTVTVETAGQTGVEMEALTAVSTACLTLYDMLKAAQKDMVIDGIRLRLKDGGKSGRFEAP